MMLLNKKQGFTLVEMLLVVGIMAIFTILKINEAKEEQLNFQAKTMAEQIKQVGQATNAYINLNYDKIVSMNNIASGESAPLTCNKNTKICKIDVSTLKHSFLLPESYSDKNIFQSGYDITLKIEGNAPNYNVNGLIITDKSLKLNQNKNQILLGKAIQYAGIDSGFSNAKNEVNGLFGSWKQDKIAYPSINQEGLFAYQVGYSSNMYSIYLRRDGTLPMTGDLNLDEHNINNIANAYVHKNLSVDGKADVKGDITSDKVIRAKSYFEGFNGSNDRFRIGGNDDNDYEFALYHNTKPLTIWRPSAGNSSTTILRTHGGIETTNGGQIVASGNIITTQKVQGQTLESLNRTKVGEYLELTQIAKTNTSCEKNGLVSRDSKGTLMSCVNLKWLPADYYATPIGSPMAWPSTNIPQGWMIADGRTFDKGRYPLLANAYPSGKLPDLRGQFIRGLDNGRGLDQNRALLSDQKDTVHLGEMKGRFSVVDKGRQVSGSFKRVGRWSASLKNGARDDWGSDIEFNAAGIDNKETRPMNVAFLYIIRAE